MKKKQNKNIIWFFDDVYTQEYLVIFAPTYKKYMQMLKEEIGYKEPNEEEPNGITGEFKGLSTKRSSLAVIWSSDKSNNLVHEIFHACAWVLKNRDIWLNPETEETYAYYYTFIYRMIKERIRNGQN